MSNQIILDDVFSINNFFNQCLKYKFTIMLIILICSSVSAVSSLFLKDIYKSSSLVLISEEASNLAGMQGSLGGLAALSGINIDSLSGGRDLKSYSLKYIKSREFIYQFILTHNLLVPLMATDSWDKDTNTVVVDPQKYDTSKNEWVIKAEPPKSPQPTLQEAYKEFMSILNVEETRNSNFITLSIEHKSPYLAKEWLDLIVTDINTSIRNKELNEAQKALDYLNQKISLTSIKNVEVILYDLIESKIKTIMLANIKDEYLFEVVDPPIVEERRAKPNRILIVIIGIFIGSFISLLFIIRSIYLSQEATNY